MLQTSTVKESTLGLLKRLQDEQTIFNCSIFDGNQVFNFRWQHTYYATIRMAASVTSPSVMRWSQWSSASLCSTM